MQPKAEYMHTITLAGIEKQFGAIKVLKSLSLDIEAGEFIVLLGASGCGKSTLLSILAGLDDPTSGHIFLGDKDVTRLPPKQRDMAMVFQSYALYPTMTVRENLDFGLRMAKVPKAEIDRRVGWAADLLQLSDYLDRKPARLSGGQRQRVAIGRAIVREAKVYLFDEPLSNLDAKLRAEMRLEIRRLHAKLGATMVYVTHDQVEAMTMASRIAVMKNGIVEQFATPSEIYDKPSTLYVAGFVGSPGMNFLNGKLRAMDGKQQIQLSGTHVDISGYGFAAAGVSEKEVVLGVRPEDLQLNSGAPLLEDLPVESLELLGADSIVWFTYEGQRISARVAPSKAPAVGQRVSLGFTPARASVFDAITEQRI